MPLPNFFIIGAAKAGTTSLHFYLDQHPEIGMSTVKEPNYFSGAANGNGYPMGRVAARADYEGLFDERFRMRGEASVGYSNAPRRPGVPAAIKEAVPHPKFIYMVRDPVERTISQYRYRVAMEGERRDFAEAMSEIESPYCVYACPSLYGSQLDNYLREFDQEDVLVLEQREVPFSAWILRVAHNAALDHLRARRATPIEEVRLQDDERGRLRHERSSDLREALELLPSEQRDVLILRHIVGLSPAEIATTLGRTESSVHGLHHRGRHALQASLRGLGASPVVASRAGRTG